MAAVQGRQPFLLQGVLPIDRARVSADIIAGVTLAALAIPEVMGYTKIAGMPVITGLYTILIPIALFALFGSSRHLVVGADSATAAIMASGLAGMAATASPEYVTLAGMLALITGGYLVLARLLRLGFIANFLSRSVLVGFLTGVPMQSGRTVEKFVATVSHLGESNAATVWVSAAVIAVILGSKAISPRIPGALIAVVGAI